MYNILDHILNTFTSRKYMIFFPPGEKNDFSPQKVLLIFLCEPKTVFFLLFPISLLFPHFLSLFFLFSFFSCPFSFPSLFPFFAKACNNFFPQPLKNSYFCSHPRGMRGGQTEKYTPLVRPWVLKNYRSKIF